jgi:hypothetical protein
MKADQPSMQVRTILGDPEAISSSESAVPAGILKLHNDTLTSHLALYRIMDFETTTSGYRGAFPPPCVPSTINSGKKKNSAGYNRIFFELKNWQDVLTKFYAAVISDECEDSPIITDLDTPLQKTWSHLQHLANHHIRSDLECIIQNFRAAACHLASLRERRSIQGHLPTMPSVEFKEKSELIAISEKEWDKFDEGTQTKLLLYILDHPAANFKLPLHMSLMITMLLLLIPNNLLKTMFPRTMIISVSIHILAK